MPDPTPTPSVDHTVSVGAQGLPAFVPAYFDIASGDTVQWVWESDGHSINPDDIPPMSRWTGTDNVPWPKGYTHTYTFNNSGDYSYYCHWHGKTARGSFTVS